MKKFLGLLLLIGAVAIVLFPKTDFNINHYLYYSFCDTPVRYKIETVDNRFNLTREQFLAAVKAAETAWEKPFGRDLFDYDPSGSLSINLIFDSRQSLNNQINSLENSLLKGSTDLKTQEAEFDRLKANFETKLKAFNSTVEYYNRQGGVGSAEFDKLKATQVELQKEADKLNSLATKLNRQTADYNSQVGQLNHTVDSFNTALENRPEEGIYLSGENRIEIYFNISSPELIHTLAHEMGHSLGLDHNLDTKGIMYPYTTKTTTPTGTDLALLTKLCRKHSIFEAYLKSLNQFLTKN